MITPFKDHGNLTPQQLRFNFIHSSTRMVIERAFSLLKGRFRRLKYLDMFTNPGYSNSNNCCMHLYIMYALTAVINGKTLWVT